MPVLVYVIRDGDTHILVDTGASDPEHARRYHCPIIQSEEEQLENALRTLGLSTRDIKIIVLTHLHWDHTYNNEIFPRAKILVQRTELQYAISPAPNHWIYYEAPEAGFHPPYLKSVRNLKTVSGDFRLTSNVSLICTPGHTPGHQSVLVETGQGRYLVAGDLVESFDHWNSDPVMVGHIIHNLEDYYASFSRAKTLCDQVLPAHDARVLDRRSYP